MKQHTVSFCAPSLALLFIYCGFYQELFLVSILYYETIQYRTGRGETFRVEVGIPQPNPSFPSARMI